MRLIYLFYYLALLFVLAVLAGCARTVPFEERREQAISELSLAIEEAQEQGKYNCCIEPPCTMCYLGNWIWKDGICRCDEMIAKGEWGNVCPQCKKGIEEGFCSSSEKFCKINTQDLNKSQDI